MKKFYTILTLMAVTLLSFTTLQAQQACLHDSTIFYEDFEHQPINSIHTFILKHGKGWRLNSNIAHRGKFSLFDIRSNNSTADSIDDWAVTNAVFVKDTCTRLEFWQYDQEPMFDDFVGVVVLDGPDPSTANIIDTVYNFDSWNYIVKWKKIIIPLNQFIGDTIYIAFRYKSEQTYSNSWIIDDIRIVSPPKQDLMLYSFNPQNLIIYGSHSRPSVTIRSCGITTPQEFTINVFILQNNTQVYSSTTTVKNQHIKCHETISLTMPDQLPTLDPGDYTVKTIISFKGDLYTDNDTVTFPIHVIKPLYQPGIIYSYNFYSDSWNSNKIIAIDQGSGEQKAIASSTAPDPLKVGDYTGQYVLAATISPDQLKSVNSTDIYLINGDGRMYLWKNINFYSKHEKIQGLAYNKNEKAIYILSFEQYYDPNSGDYKHNTYLYKLDSSQSLTQIGSTSDVLAGLTFDQHGNLYSYDITSPSLVIIYYSNPLYTYKFMELNLGINYEQYNESYIPYLSLTYDNINKKTFILFNRDNELHISWLAVVDPEQLSFHIINKYDDLLGFCAIVPSPVVTFHVTTPDFYPLDSVKISIANHRILYTNKFGISKIPLNKGSYTAFISHPDYQSITKDFTVGDSSIEIHAILKPKTTTNIEDLEKSIKIYPIPCHDILTISAKEQYTLTISDFNSREILKINPYRPQNNINVSNLPQGIYIIKIKTSGGLITKKIIKQ